MKWRNITARDLSKIVDKLSLELSKTKGRSPHPVYWYHLDGKKMLRITLPNIHGGSTSVSVGFLRQVQNNLKVNTRQFEELFECPLTSKDFEIIIREKLKIF